MALTYIYFMLFFFTFTNVIELGNSKVLGNQDSRGFVTFKTNTVNQKPCTCPSINSCSCCEIVTISYTNEERKLCFNMIYQKEGLNFDLSLDSLVIKSMAVANYKPFRMCSSVPGLFFSMICVHILELNRLPGSINICPRVEVTSKKERWQITYTCSSVSTEMQGIGSMSMMGTGTGMPVQLMMAGMMTPIMPGAMTMMGAMPNAGQIVMPKPGAAAPGQTTSSGTATMTFTMAPGGTLAMRPSAAVAILEQTPPMVQGMMMSQKPATPGLSTMTLPMPPAINTINEHSGTAPTMTMYQKPLNTSSRPLLSATTVGQMSPSPSSQPSLGTIPIEQRPSNLTLLMPQAGQIIPKLADQLLYTIKPSYLQLTSHDNDSVTDGIKNVEYMEGTTIHHNKSDILNYYVESSSTAPEIESYLHQSTFKLNPEELVAKQIKTFQGTISGNLKRQKRSYDVFDIYQQTNRCQRTYRICITRSNQYIISRLMNFRKNKNRKPDCLYKPARIVYKAEENLCSNSNPVDTNNSSESITSNQKNHSLSQNDDTLDAIIIHDDSYEDSASQSVNTYPLPITAYRKNPQITQLIQEEINKNCNGINILKKTSLNFELDNIKAATLGN